MHRKIFSILFIIIIILVNGSAFFGHASAASCSAEQGQSYIDQGRYDRAVREFTCVINIQPTEVEGYRGRIEAELLLGQFSNALRDYVQVTAKVLPVHPDAESVIHAGYESRLAADPNSVPALTGASFARWYFFEYAQGIQLLNQLVEVQPDGVYANLFSGSTRVLLGATPPLGTEYLERAIALAPKSPDVRFIVADAYLYGRSDYARSLAEATLALEWGLDTPRVHAIIASGLNAAGDQESAAAHIQRHIELVTTELIPAPTLSADASLDLDLLPGWTYSYPVPATAGETLSIMTSSHDFSDTIMVLLAPDGTPVVGSDDSRVYYAAINWPVPQTGLYLLQVTSFESASIGTLIVTRK